MIALVLFFVFGVICDSMDLSQIGYGVYLPKISYLSPSAVYPILSINESSIQKTVVDKALYEFSYFEDQKSFYSYAALQAQVGLSFTYDDYTFGMSLEAVYSSAQEEDFMVEGVSNHYTHIYADYELEPSSYNFNAEVSSAINTLPSVIQSPQLESSWEAYKSFFQKHGSHTIVGVAQGSRLETFSMTKSSEKYSQQDFQIKSCLDLEGPTPLNFSMSICAQYSKEKRKSVSSLNIDSRMFVLGGTSDTRSKLMVGRTADLILEFLNEFNVSTSPIIFYYKSIWDIIFEKYSIKSSEYLVGKNLQAYYLGFLAYGCELYQDGSTVLKEFQYVEDERYVCQRPTDGCESSGDCHIGGAGSVCYCYGDTCIDSVSSFEYGRDFAKVRHSEAGSYDEGINNSCHYHVGVYCDCENSHAKTPCVIWDQDLNPPTPSQNACHPYGK